MRNAIMSLLLICVAVSWGAVASANAPQVYWERVGVPNTSFEMPVDNGLIPGWSGIIGVPGDRGSITVSRGSASEGACSVRFEDREPNASTEIRSERIAVTPGVFYTAAVDVFIESGIGTSACIYLEFLGFRRPDHRDYQEML